MRFILASWGLYYYHLFSRRLDAVFYDYKSRMGMSAFFVLEALAMLLFGFFGALPFLGLLQDIGRLGVAVMIFMASLKALKQAHAATIFVSPLVLRVADTGIDIVSMASITLVLLAIRNFSVYSKILKPSVMHTSARKFFLLSVLAAYVFQFVGTLIDMDVALFVELLETMAVVVGFYMVRSVVKSESSSLAGTR